MKSANPANIRAGRRRQGFPVLSATRAAYLAGLFDGEGSISIGSAQARWPINATIASSAEDGFLARLRTSCGNAGSLTVRAASRGVRAKWRWTLVGRALEWFLRTIEPWTELKRDHVGIALDFCALKRRTGKLHARDHTNRRLLRLALDYAHLRSGSHKLSRRSKPGSKAAERTRRVIADIGQVLRWKLLPEEGRRLARGVWTRHGIPFPFYEASA